MKWGQREGGTGQQSSWQCIEWSILGSLSDTSLGFCVMPKSLFSFDRGRQREGKRVTEGGVYIFGVYWVLLMAYEIDFWLMSTTTTNEAQARTKTQNSHNNLELIFNKFKLKLSSSSGAINFAI